MNTRCLMLMTGWMALTLGGCAFLAGTGLKALIGTAVVLVPWLMVTAIVLCGVLLHPEEV